MSKTNQRPTLSIRVTVVSIFIFASIFTAAIAIALQYYFSQSMAQKHALQLYDGAANNVSSYIDQKDEKAEKYSALLANFNNLIVDKTLHPDALQLFANILTNNELYSSIYLGFPNGDLQQLVNLNKLQNNRESLKANHLDRWVLISITTQGEQRIRQYSYFDEAFVLREKRQEKTSYDATQRIWYQNATASKVHKSETYIFAQSGLRGQTYSCKVPNTKMVLGLDITLNSLSSVLQKQSKHQLGDIINEVYLYKSNGELLATNQKMELNTNNTLTTIPYPALIKLAQQKTDFNKLKAVSINKKNYYVYISPVGQKYGQINYLAILVPESVLFSDSIKRIEASILISILCLILLLPLSWLFSSPIIRPIKALALEAEKVKNREYKQLQPIISNIIEIQELSDSIVDMHHSIENYQTDQKQLMESFIQLIAQAIDDKSPYTAGHCNRVPELGVMLAAVAETSDLPAFKAFKFKNEDEFREFHIAAWLHDCGKITTPEYIVDKGTKLEAIYNRIHEVRMRFEVLWRDAEIHYYQQKILDPSQEKQYKEALIKQQLQLTNDFEFIANSNVGGEFMAEQDIARLKEIGSKTWQRNFDNRAGLSPIEELNLASNQQQLPVQEFLLSDKNEHIIKRHNKVEFNPKFGIKMDIPEHLYNQGELYNLSITRGTLTREDRFKINQHVTSTIKMLENLPFPPELARVPRYASTHHETMKGTGYPRRLKAEDLSIPERILIIADIFEALTAADRPYKKAKPMSEAIDILHSMALEQHIDMDLFKLFLTSGTHLKYAQKFLDKKQIDEVDINKYLT